MEINVLSTQTQKRYTLNVQENTLGSLKNVLRQNNINFEGMIFYEGRTKTELVSDSSTFPENAVIRLTQAEKKFKSGVMSRTEAYSYIKSNNLGEEVKRRYGKNFTQCSTSDLLTLISDSRNVSDSPAIPTVEENISPDVKCETTKKATFTPGSDFDFDSWISMGIKHNFIDKETAALLQNGVKVSSIDSEYEKMFDFCK